MAVKVTISRSSVGKPHHVNSHPTAAAFIVRDGNLFVLAQNRHDSDVLAVYAPGQWSDAEVVTGA